MARSLPCIISALALSAVAAHAQVQNPDVADVVSAERAFAADGLATGVDASFLKWSTEDAVLIGGGDVQRAHATLDPHAVFDPSAPSLVWWPNWAGIARSGDLGFTTGGVEVGGVRRGHYFTIWQRQPDGRWKWVYDGGTGASAADVPGPQTEPAFLAPPIQTSLSPDVALSEVRAVESVLAASALRDQKAAHLSLLADDARLYVAPLPPATGRGAFESALDAWPQSFEFSQPLGGGSSAAGDLVWDYGRAQWTREGSDRWGYYVHLWQKRMSGWHLVFAQLIADPPTSAPPAPPAIG